ncbi:MAG TPA: UDP-N-acetylmuramate dehydrogenase, partial [Desulfobacteraceae bacterium]|nr:UDP-N-acetylmuramate dehydrogenase [Desulfobacteraceae bacterium]
YLVIGNGSNLLITDRGFDGVAVVIGRGFSGFAFEEDPKGLFLTAGAGLPISSLVSGCSAEGFSGLEFLAWIPGTAGGAVAMNAGAFGHETAEAVREVHALSPGGDLVVFDKSSLSFGYRCSDITPGTVIASVVFDVKRARHEDVAGAVAHYGGLRRRRQPLGMRSAGSVFKNPPGRYAGELIEVAGLKGKRIGGAMISDVHANFIVNTGGAGSDDVLRLVELAKRKVYQAAGIELELEIRVVGER